MSGFEIAGIVLGGFPILVKCLEHYRQGFEPLEEWWNFRSHFIAFVDDIRHQMMRYHENLTRLLDPIIADTDDLASLIRDSSLADQRWHDSSLEGPLKQRLASEHDRFFRILGRMQEVVADLERSLQIDNGKVSWIGSSEQKPWQWHFKRIQFSFSKGKHKRVRKLAACNDELQEILGYSERVIPIADKRKSSEPIRLLEKIRQHACGVYSVLKQQWRCDRSCEPKNHEAHLSLGAAAVPVSLDMIFILNSSPGDSRQSWQQVQIVPTDATPTVLPTDISHIQQSALLANVQKSLMQQNLAASKQRPRNALPLKSHWQSMRSSLKAPSGENGIRPSSHPERNVQFDTAVSVASSTPSISTLDVEPRPSNSQHIVDLCLFLANNEPESGVLKGNTDRHFRLQKIPKDPQAPAAGEIQLVPLPELMAAYHHALIDISRQRRFEMATHIASALLQAHTSPWLSESWSKTDFYFLVDAKSGSLRSTYPFFSRRFHPIPSPASYDQDNDDIPNSNRDDPQMTIHGLHGQLFNEESTRACLFTAGVMILELIFGHNIEDCRFRKEYYGNDHKPNDQTDVCTARRWAKNVLGESGASIADVVRRCLDCSFGPRPDFRDVRFRESVYEGVIKPLADYSKTWPEVMQ